MKNFDTFEIIVVLLIFWGAVELVRGYWQILLALAILGAVMYFAFRSGKTSQKTEINLPSQEYEVKRAAPKLPPMPYSAKNVELTKLPAQISPFQQIPPDVAELLWFDGQINMTKIFCTPLFTLEIEYNGEPSLIDRSLPVGRVVSPAPKIGYFPSYARLTADERATYLNWLRNVDTPIDIGYVFIFYYGLERHLVAGDFRHATEMIFRLRAHHKNASFDAYSSNALLAAAIARNDDNVVGRLMHDDFYLSPITLALFAKENAKLNSQALIALASRVGFTNKRYIKNEPVMFLQSLDEILTARFAEPFFPLTENLLSDCPKVSELVFANTSLSMREIEVPDVTSNEQFRREVGDLLSTAHENVKAKLKLLRKRR